MKQYELTVLIHPDLEIDLEKPLAKLRTIITDNSGKIIKETSWGKKKLAYSIAKQDFAVYVHFELEFPATNVAKFSNTLNISEEILRYLLISVDEKTKAKLAAASKRKNQDKDEEK